MEIKKIIVDEVPKSCKLCKIENEICMLHADMEMEYYTQRHADCPLIAENDVVITDKKTTP